MISFSRRRGLSTKKKKKKLTPPSKEQEKAPQSTAATSRAPPHVYTDRFTQTGTIPLLQPSQMKKGSNGCRHRQKLFTIPIKAKLPAEESNFPKKTMNDLLYSSTVQYCTGLGLGKSSDVRLIHPTQICLRLPTTGPVEQSTLNFHS